MSPSTVCLHLAILVRGRGEPGERHSGSRHVGHFERSPRRRRERLRGTVLRDTQTAHRERHVDVPRDLGGRLDRHAAFEDRSLAVSDRHVGQRQLEDDCKERRTEPNSVEKSTFSRTISPAASSAPRWCLRS